MNGVAGLIDWGLTKLLAGALGKPGKRQSRLLQGFLLGHALTPHSEEPGEPVVLSHAERRKHLYTLGATGCGKTTLLLRLIADEIASGRTVVVVDLRGDLIDGVLGICVGEPDVVERVHLVDLREDEYVAPFNPLSGPGDAHSKALHLLEIERALEDAAFRNQVLRRCTDSRVRSFFARYDSLSPERMQAWSLPVLNKVTAFLSTPQLRRVLGARGGFDLPGLIDKPGQILLVALAAHRFHGASQLLGGLLVNSIQNAAMARAGVPEEKRNQATLVVDEFETMASPSFGAIVAEGRRFGLSLVLAHQNLSQLDAGLRQVLRNNVHTQLFFQTGSLDANELAPEICSRASREEVRQSLIRQKVGQAYLVRRGEPPVQIATVFEPRPAIDAAKLGAFKRSTLEACCRPRSEVDLELALPAAALADPATGSVRHQKKPRRGAST